MKKRIEDLLIIKKEVLLKEFLFLEVKSQNPFDFINPGQFVEVLISGSPGTFLRRPFSIHDVNYEKNTLQIIIKMVGDGTRSLNKLKEGDFLNIIFPLGNGFTTRIDNQALLVGGGYGIAPLYHLAKEIICNGGKPVFLFGARNKDQLVLLEKFSGLAPTFITTEDGSHGFKGIVTGSPVFNDPGFRFEKVFVCGPEPMMKAVSRLAESKNIDCEISLDNLMGCGIGVCLCCITPTDKGNEVVCQSGPVFNSKVLKW